MSALIPFESASLPVRNVARMSISADVIRQAEYPVISIKGKQFTIVRDGVKSIMTKPDDPDEVAQNIQVVVLRANTHSRVFYAKQYVEGESDGAKPTCYSFDGISPDANSEEPQSKKCQLCPHAVWGSKNSETGKGTACSVNARLAVAAPDKLDEAFLMRAPAGSIAGFKEVVKIAKQRGLEYNEVVVKIGFDREAPSPKLTFKPVAVLADADYTAAVAMYENDTVKEIVGVPSEGVAKAAVAVAADPLADELDAALAARSAAKKAAESAKKAPAPVVEDDEPAPAPKKKAAPAPVAEDDEPAPAPKKKAAPVGDSLIDDLEALLGNTDD